MKKITLVIAYCLLVSSFAFGQYPNHSYPRTGIFLGGNGPAAYFQYYDLVMTHHEDDGFAVAVKGLNENGDAVVISAITDWNTAAGITIPNEWKAIDKDGNYCTSYGTTRLVDITNYCPQIPAYGNRRYNEYLMEYMAESARLGSLYYDGVMSHGTWNYPSSCKRKVDLDRNSEADWNENGKGENWLHTTWCEGVDTCLQGIRRRIGPSPLIIMNSGAWNEYGEGTVNGHFLEKTEWIKSFSYWMRKYDEAMNNSKTPNFIYIDGATSTKHNYKNARFVLGATLYGNGYYGVAERAGCDHQWEYMIDEMFLDLGYPTSSMQPINIRIPSEGYGTYVRFFDKGAVILNVDSVAHSVSVADIQGKTGYAGPYYHFIGGQEASLNDGSLFDGINLIGNPRFNNEGKYSGARGDAIILVNPAQTAVAPIVIDTDNEQTSPGSDKADLAGSGWIEDDIGDHVRDYYASRIKISNRYNLYAFAYVPSGNGSATATFRPTIGKAGNYQVYEWHGYLQNEESASNVPYTLVHSGGTENGTINQQINRGQWNLIGTYHFNTGSSGYFRITNSANGYVIADAIKLVYEKSEQSIRPNPPTDLGCAGSTETTISLEWEAPGPAEDGNLASEYMIFRNDIYAGSSTSTSFTDNGLAGDTEYIYTVFSYDDARNRSETPATTTCRTLQGDDDNPPTIISAEALSATLVSVTFSEPVNEAVAENEDNYSINDGDIRISSVQPQANECSIHIQTLDVHVEGTTYTLTVNNIIDKASPPNKIADNSTIDYVWDSNGVPEPEPGTMQITLSADNNYWLYVNGVFKGTDTEWEEAETYNVNLNSSGKNIIAVKCTDNVLISKGGFVAKINFDGKVFVTDESWKISTTEEPGWETTNFDDQDWEYATSYGLLGVAQPWCNYNNNEVTYLPNDEGIKWIWTDDNVTDQTVYIRFTFDFTPSTLEAPQGLKGCHSRPK